MFCYPKLLIKVYIKNLVFDGAGGLFILFLVFIDLIWLLNLGKWERIFCSLPITKETWKSIYLPGRMYAEHDRLLIGSRRSGNTIEPSIFCQKLLDVSWWTHSQPYEAAPDESVKL